MKQNIRVTTFIEADKNRGYLHTFLLSLKAFI